MKYGLEKLLEAVQKPGRYTGGEVNSVIKDKNKVDIRYAFCFPDTYEIGMSHLGMKILYGLVNAREDAWCERVFAPWTDMEEQMRQNNVPLFALESQDPIKDFDVIGFTMQYELSYTNVLNMLDLAGLPVLSKERTQMLPVVIAGGPCVCNGEPIADFIDLFLPGEGEEVTGELLDLIKEYKKKGASKEEFLRAAAQIEGVYVPSLYEVAYHDDGTIQSVTPTGGAPEKVKKRIIADLDKVYYPENFVVPYLDVVHDRAVEEIFRGCPRGCRFCQAGFLYRPLREKSVDVICRQSRSLCDSTGYDEISLNSLSTSDYTKIEKLLPELIEWTSENKINLSLPSLRVDNFSDELAEQLQKIRRSGLTFAPEAGTQRLRDVINKNVSEDEILATAEKAFRGGWNLVKLYFMMGLPTETLEDIEGIAKLAQKVVDAYYHCPERKKGRSVTVNISVASFVPKPFTPFQWEPQDTMEMLAQKQKHLVHSLTSKKISASWHDVETSFLEGVLARGDRRLGKVIEAAWRKDCHFDSWDEQFHFERWMEAFRECGLKPSFYANRRRAYDEILPWDHMDYGVSKAFLQKQDMLSKEGVTTPQCREACAGCGANRLNGGACDALR